MGDLISRRKLIANLRDLDVDCEEASTKRTIERCFNQIMPKIINDEPTAFDIEKVKQEIQEMYSWIPYQSGKEAVWKDDVVKIIERGGIDG